MATFTLSTVPSEALLQALDELEVTERTPGYTIAMMEWHRPMNGVCYVCLSGSTMRAMGADKNTQASLLEFGSHDKMLHALSCLSFGIIDWALGRLGIEQPSELPKEVPAARYSANREQFFADMRSLAALLKEHGV